MKPEQLDKFIAEGRRNKTPDDQIKQQLLVGGWNAEAIDKALQKSSASEDNTKFVAEESYTVPQPVFFTAFLVSFIALLIFFNFVTYFGQITGSESSPPVTNTELIGGVIFSFIGAIVLGVIYSLIVKVVRKLKK